MSSDREDFSFQVQLLLNIINMKNYPFTQLVIENSLTKEEYLDLIQLLDGLEKDYFDQKKQGFMNFSILLVHFAGMLNDKLLPDETIYALKQEGYYVELMEEFIKVMDIEY